MARAKKTYVVFIGRQTGIFDTYKEVQQHVNGFSCGRQKGYATRDEAEKAWNEWLQKLNTTKSPQTAGAVDVKPALIARPNKELPKAGTTSQSLHSTGQNSNLKRLNTIDLTDSDVDKYLFTKKIKSDQESFGSNADFLPPEVEEPLPLNEKPIILTPAQQAVVDMAMKGNNIFLTGAAGSGKTATLKEILRRITEKHRSKRRKTSKNQSKYPKVQVVAPTGIAALPLDGKTTYSFAGW